MPAAVDFAAEFVGINKGTEAEQFFQSDADIKTQQRRDAKKQQTEQRGQPVRCSSKVLCMTLTTGTTAFVGESGFLFRRVNLSVLYLSA
jgi:hypothetical protein